MSQTLERRTFEGEVEFRKGEGKTIKAGGYAARFNVLSQNLGGFVERVKPGTFAKTIQEADVRALFNHDPNLLLGRNRAGTLELGEDRTGLAYEITLPDNTAGRDVAVSLERKDITGSSFGFRTILDSWGETEDGFPLRTLEQVSLRDVGPVTFPAYTEASSSLRSLAEARSLDLNDLIAAAGENRLREMLAERSEGGEEETEEERQEAEDRETNPILRRRFGHLL